MGEKFAEPDVAPGAMKKVRQIATARGPIEPWHIITEAEDKGIEKSEARKALRGLKMSNEIVPAGDFTGEVRLVEK